MGIRIKQRIDTAANWTANNPTLQAGEVGWESDTGKCKLGDGATVWTSLAYRTSGTDWTASSANFSTTGTLASADITVTESNVDTTESNLLAPVVHIQNTNGTANNYSAVAFKESNGQETSFIVGKHETHSATVQSGSIALYGVDAGTANLGLTVSKTGAIGFGTETPLSGIHAISTSSTGAGLRVDLYETSATGPSYTVGKSRGTEGTPVAVTTSDALYTQNFRGHTGTAFQTGASITVSAAEGFVEATAYGTTYKISTAAIGETALTDRFTIDSGGNAIFSGNTGIGATTLNYDLHIERSSGDANIGVVNTAAGGNVFAVFDSQSGGSDAFALGVRKSTGNFVIADGTGITANERLIIDTTGHTTVTSNLYTSSGSRVSTGGETAPDCSAGGVTVNTGGTQARAITVKNSTSAHGMTAVEETDTYFTLGGNADDFANSEGGVKMNCLSDGFIACMLKGTVTTEQTTDASNSPAAIYIDGTLKNGTAVQPIGSTGNVFAVGNNTTTLFLVKGNGDLHATNTTITALDNENDLLLARNLQLATGGSAYQHRVSPDAFQKLVDVKAISSNGDYQIMQGINAVTLGAISQLSNILGFIGQRLGIDPDELLEAAKDYNHSLTDNR